MCKNKTVSKGIKQYKTLYRREGRNAFKAPMKMACNIITSNCCSLDTLTLILFKPLGNKCFKSRAFGTLELAGFVRSLRKGKGKVSSKEKELNNQFKISFYVDRQPLIPTFLTLALYVDFFFFSIPSPDGFLLLQISRGCQIFQSAPGWNQHSFLATPPPPLSRALFLPQTTRSPSLLPPPRNSERAEEREGEQAKKS